MPTDDMHGRAIELDAQDNAGTEGGREERRETEEAGARHTEGGGTRREGPEERALDTATQEEEGGLGEEGVMEEKQEQGDEPGGLAREERWAAAGEAAEGEEWEERQEVEAIGGSRMESGGRRQKWQEVKALDTVTQGEAGSERKGEVAKGRQEQGGGRARGRDRIEEEARMNKVTMARNVNRRANPEALKVRLRRIAGETCGEEEEAHGKRPHAERKGLEREGKNGRQKREKEESTQAWAAREADGDARRVELQRVSDMTCLEEEGTQGKQPHAEGWRR
jgi:hypothetical protein